MSYPAQQGGSQGGGGSGDTTSPNPGSSTSLPASRDNKVATVSGVIGGIGGLLLLSLLGVWCLQRRKQNQNGTGARKARPVTYNGLNGVLSGARFSRSSRRQSPHTSLLPPPVSQASGTRLALRGGQSSQRVSGNELDSLPPSYAESQMSVSMASLGRMATHRTNSDMTPAPLCFRSPGANTITPQTTGGATFMSLERLDGPDQRQAITISPQTTGSSALFPQRTGGSQESYVISPQATGANDAFPRHSRDTMGFPATPTPYETPLPMLVQPMPLQHTRDTMEFPVEQEQIRIQPDIPTAIVSPIARHPLVHQDSLERVVRQGLMPSESPIPSNANRIRVVSQQIPRDTSNSRELSPVRMNPTTDVTRNNTVSTISSMGIDVVSDRELERLGVGANRR